MKQIRDFHFKQFSIAQTDAPHPTGTDGVLAGAWAGGTGNFKQILDIGTGTGVVALMLAQRFPSATVTAIEPDDRAMANARHNFSVSFWNDRMLLYHQTIQQFAAETREVFDLIVSNPPFFQQSLAAKDRSRHLARHTDTLPFEDLVQAVVKLLAPKGCFCVILPKREGLYLCEIAVVHGLYFTEIMEVHSFENTPCERLLIRMERSPLPFNKAKLILYEKPNQYSKAYMELTKEFYRDFKESEY